MVLYVVVVWTGYHTCTVRNMYESDSPRRRRRRTILTCSGARWSLLPAPDDNPSDSIFERLCRERPVICGLETAIFLDRTILLTYMGRCFVSKSRRAIISQTKKMSLLWVDMSLRYGTVPVSARVCSRNTVRCPLHGFSPYHIHNLARNRNPRNPSFWWPRNRTYSSTLVSFRA